MNETTSTPGPATLTQPEVSQAVALPSSPVLQRPAPPDVGSLGKVHTLSDAEYMELLVCEEVIRTGWRTFVDVGLALATIRDKKLYEQDYVTFEAYYRARWHFQQTKVYCWMSAAHAFKSIAALSDVPQPDNEFQLRPLYGLTPEQVQQAWRQAASAASGRPITARLVRSAVAQLNLNANSAMNRRPHQERQEYRRQLAEGITELLKLVMSKAAYDVLLQQAIALDSHARHLFPDVYKKK